MRGGSCKASWPLQSERQPEKASPQVGCCMDATPRGALLAGWVVTPGPHGDGTDSASSTVCVGTGGQTDGWMSAVCVCVCLGEVAVPVAPSCSQEPPGAVG